MSRAARSRPKSLKGKLSSLAFVALLVAAPTASARDIDDCGAVWCQNGIICVELPGKKCS